MSFLTTSLFSLAGIPLQIDPGGFSISAVQQVDLSEPWVARARCLSLRNKDDMLTTEIETIGGARVLVSFSSTGASTSAGVSVPRNDAAALNSLCKKALYRQITLQGTAMDSSDFSTLLAAYDQAQIYWLQRQTLLAKLSIEDIPAETLLALVEAYHDLEKPVIPLSSPLLSENVTFAQGSSCTFSQALNGYVSDFSLSVIQELS